MIRYLAAAILVTAAPALAQTPAQVAPLVADSTGAMAAANAAMDAIGNKDGKALEALLLPQAVILSQNYAADGQMKTRIRTRDEMIAGLVGSKGKLAEKMVDPRLLIQHDLAHVWAPYTFDVDGKRSHCGIDSIGLARIDGSWRITSVTWTAEPYNCPQ
jgi:hypothetical protein